MAYEEAVHFEEEIEDEEFTAAELLSDGYVKKVQNENQVYYAKRLGDIWKGRPKANTKNKDSQIKMWNYHPVPEYLRKL